MQVPFFAAASAAWFSMTLVAPPATASPAAAAGPAACAPAERTVFACRAGARRIAVCASQPLGATGGQLQYRFGPPASAELVFPAAGDDWRAVTQGAAFALAGGGGAYLGFTRGDYRYVVYTAIGRGWGERAGVVVERGGRRIGHVRCTEAPVSAIGPALFDEAGVPPGPDDFDLP